MSTAQRPATSADSFGARGSLTVGDACYEVFRLTALDDAIGRGWRTLPYSLKVLLENLLRTESGAAGADVTAEHIRALAGWDAEATPSIEIQYTPARVIMQDFTGVPCVVDLATMREAVTELGGDPQAVNPLAPAELVIDHSVIADIAGSPDAFERNVDLEYRRNRERYQFLRWGQGAFDEFKVVPPGTGIVHQVNIEHLARTVMTRSVPAATGGHVRQAYPDTVVGTDSHTTMVNGLGVLGWGVGGIEAEAAMLGQPVSMLIPRVVGFKLTGEIPAAVTATDVVLTITEMLREHGVVGKFVEFYGEGVAAVPLANRATIGNMSPEFGSTCAIFPIDEETVRYLQLTGRSEKQVALVEAYAKDQELWHDPSREATYSEYLELDLSTVVPSIAGPKRPQDRVALSDMRTSFQAAFPDGLHSHADGTEHEHPAAELTGDPGTVDEASVESFPASDPPSYTRDPDAGDKAEPAPPRHEPEALPADAHYKAAEVRIDGQSHRIRTGSVVIAAITSCTNTSNPSVMVAAGLLARNAVERGMATKPWVKTSLAPGSRAVTDYLNAAGLMEPLEVLRFHLVGYGCTTCIGNSGPLAEPVAEALEATDIAGVAVLSGNRNFEGRIHPLARASYLASPPLVVAFALAGRVDIDLTTDPIGTDRDGAPVMLSDIWPSPQEVASVVLKAVSGDIFTRNYASVFDGDDRWRELPVPAGDRYAWDPESTYVARPTFFDGIADAPAELSEISGARALAMLGDSVTTDHISPAGSIARSSPAGEWLMAHGVEPREFNSYGSRRGHHEVMMRGTFANIRLRNLLTPGDEGNVTEHIPSGERMSIFDAAMRYAEEGTPLILLAGREYGSGSSRDWAAKGPMLQGVRAVIAESYERIHRSNLVGMGILPLQYLPGESASSLGLTGRETFDVLGLADALRPRQELAVVARGGNGREIRFRVIARLDGEIDLTYMRNGGVLQTVLRRLAAAEG